LTAFLCGVARQVALNGITINFLLPGSFDTDRLNHNMEITAKNQSITLDQARANPRRHGSGEALRLPGRIRCGLRVPVLGARRLHHGTESADRRRRVPRRVLSADGVPLFGATTRLVVGGRLAGDTVVARLRPIGGG